MVSIFLYNVIKYHGNIQNIQLTLTIYYLPLLIKSCFESFSSVIGAVIDLTYIFKKMSEYDQESRQNHALQANPRHHVEENRTQKTYDRKKSIEVNKPALASSSR